MRRHALALILAALPAAAQDREGRNTPGDWVVTHYKPFGLWDSICDERPEGGRMHRRCYIRYVDVFSPRPNFAAHFVFVTPDGDGVSIEYGSEPGTRFTAGGHWIERDGTKVWLAEDIGCLTGRACSFSSVAASDLYREMRAGGSWRFLFADRHGQLQDLTWNLDPFAAAAEDFEAEVAARGLR